MATSIIDSILEKLRGVKKAGDNWVALCPAHDDRTQSLSVGTGGDGRVLLKCFAGCRVDDILARMQIEFHDLFPPSNNSLSSHKIISVEELAKHKKLPVSFLRELGVEDRPHGGVKITYRLLDGSFAPRQRIRTALTAKEGSLWDKGAGTPVPYGLWKIKEFSSHEFLLIVEGESDAWSAWFHGLPAIGIPGADMGRKLEAEHLAPFSRIYIFQEPDKGGNIFVSGLVSRLAEVKFTGKSFVVKLDGIKDLNELHKQSPEKFKEEIEKSMASAREVRFEDELGDDNEKDDESLPSLDAGELNLKKISRLAWVAVKKLNLPPFLFRSGSMATRLERDDAGIPKLRELNPDKLRHVLARAAYWFREIRREIYPALPPMHCVRDMLAWSDIPLPILNRIVEAPVFSSKGQLQIQPGYHTENQTFYFESGAISIPEISSNPCPEEIEKAKGIILNELIKDFPFVGPAEIAHSVSLLLLPFARDLIEGATPLYLIEAPSPGTGKTLLVNALSFPSLGHPVPTLSEGRDEDEWRKRLTAKIMQRPDVILIDNLRRRLDSASLASALTSPSWEDRVLGHSRMVSLPVRCVWVATGNNPSLSNEIARRSIRIRMDSNVDRPWLREGFRHPNLMKWVKDNRSEIIWSALTLIQNWISKDKPASSNTILGMYESWSQTMGGVLQTAGIEGFLSNLNEFYAAGDEETMIIREFVKAWWDKYGDSEVGVSELFDLNSFLEAPIDLGRGEEKSQRTKLGQELVKLRDRQFDGLRIVLVGTRQRAKRWKLISADERRNLGEPFSPNPEKGLGTEALTPAAAL